jgi:hypothetical protein
LGRPCDDVKVKQLIVSIFNSVPGVPHVQKWNALPARNLPAGIQFKGPASLSGSVEGISRKLLII